MKNGREGASRQSVGFFDAARHYAARPVTPWTGDGLGPPDMKTCVGDETSCGLPRGAGLVVVRGHGPRPVTGAGGWGLRHRREQHRHTVVAIAAGNASSGRAGDAIAADGAHSRSRHRYLSPARDGQLASSALDRSPGHSSSAGRGCVHSLGTCRPGDAAGGRRHAAVGCPVVAERRCPDLFGGQGRRNVAWGAGLAAGGHGRRSGVRIGAVGQCRRLSLGPPLCVDVGRPRSSGSGYLLGLCPVHRPSRASCAWDVGPYRPNTGPADGHRKRGGLSPGGQAISALREVATAAALRCPAARLRSVLRRQGGR